MTSMADSCSPRSLPTALEARVATRNWSCSNNKVENMTFDNPHRKATGLFTCADDADDIKRKVRNAMIGPVPYHVSQYYKTEGIPQAIARSLAFDNASLFAIAANAVYIAVDTDWNKDTPMSFGETRSMSNSPIFFVVMENIFCAYFLGEWIIRFMAFEYKRNCLRDRWFVFDAVLVIIMVIEIWCLSIFWPGFGGNTPVLRLIRLLRLSRMMRMLQIMPDLMIHIKGMRTALKPVFYVMILLLMVTYVFGILFTQLSQGNSFLGHEYFSSVPHSMYSLLIYLTLLDRLAIFLNHIRDHMWPLLLPSMIFIGLAALTVMNLFIGVLCEVISSVQNAERENLLAVGAAEQLQAVLASIDADHNNLISWEEFISIIDKPEALRALEEAGVNPLAVVDIAELIFFDGEEPIDLTFEVFVDTILDLRDTRIASVKDVVNIWKQIKTTTNFDLAQLHSDVRALEQKLDYRTDKLEQQLSSALEALGKIASKFDMPLPRPMLSSLLLPKPLPP